MTDVPETASGDTAAGLIDLHCHVLPGIDDGADSLDEAVAMCRAAAAGGCSAMVATPHLRHNQWWNGERRAIASLHGKLRDCLRGHPKLYLGGEIAVNSASVEEIYELPRGELLTLAGSRYVLLELDWHGIGPDVFEVVHELKILGLFPVIAHPERVRWLATEPALIELLVERGAFMQLTAMSVTGDFGPGIRSLCDDFVKAGLAHFVASDAHDLRLRPPGLRAAYERIAERFGEDAAQRLFAIHPRAVLDDQPLPA